MRRIMAQFPVDLVILDLILPGEDGLTLARSIRDETNIGIIILSGRGEPVERIIGLEMGADDYLPKPFPSAGALGSRQERVASGLNSNHGKAGAGAIEGRVRRMDPRSFEPGALFGQGGRAHHRRIRFARGLRQQPQSGVDPAPAARSCT